MATKKAGLKEGQAHIGLCLASVPLTIPFSKKNQKKVGDFARHKPNLPPANERNDLHEPGRLFPAREVRAEMC